MKTKEDILAFWNSLAKTEGESYKASWNDYYMREKEIETLSLYIKDGNSICDFGCNNGYCAFKLLENFSTIKVTGVDYSFEAIQCANKVLNQTKHKDRAKFFVGDITKVETYPKDKFDVVFCKRTIINVPAVQDQIAAIQNLSRLLKDTGCIVLMEAVEENLVNLNKMREEFGLSPLDMPWHNNYLSKTVVDYIHDNFYTEDIDYSSTYYLISRVFNPVIKTLLGKKFKYLDEINRLAYSLPNYGDYGIQRLFVLRKKNA